jgi:hypothetical protein
MVKYSFNINNGLEGNLYKYLGPIYDARRKAVEKAEMGSVGQTVLLLEDFGSTLKMGAWTNEDGIFLTYRISPGYSDNARARGAANYFETAIKNIFGNRGFTREVENPEDPNSKITLCFKGLVTSIGD